MCAHSRNLGHPALRFNPLAFCKTDRYLDTFPDTLAFMRSPDCLTLRIVAKVHGYLTLKKAKIMDTSYKHYMNLTPNQLHARLIARKTPPFQAEHIKKIVAEQQAERKSENARTKQLTRLWREYMQPLEAERDNVQGMLRYKGGENDEARREALQAYLVVLNALKAKMINHCKQGRKTPTMVAEEKKLINEGKHWTDWVPAKIKGRVIDLFAQIERKPKAKIKIPFDRVIPATLHAKQLTRLRNRTLRDLEMAKQEHELDPSEDRQAKVRQIEYALDLMDVLDDSEPVPATWHGLNKNGSR
jgi:hypothetical protein